MVMEKYLYSGGEFRNIGNSNWGEWQQGQLKFNFRETQRNNEWIYLFDISRNIWVALPTSDGKSYYAWSGGSWTELYDLKKYQDPDSGMTDKTQKIINFALSHVGMIDYSRQVQSTNDPGKTEPFGWKLLDNIFFYGAQKKWPESELKKTWRPGRKDWCGIFGTYCFQGAEVSAIWSLINGRPEGSVKKINSWDASFGGSRNAFEATIMPGDMAVIPEASHHFIVVSIDQGSGTIESVDGNQEFGRIDHLHTRKLSKVVAYYRAL